MDPESAEVRNSFEEFMTLFLRHELRLLRYLRTLIPRSSDAEDALQETAITLWRRFDRFEKGTNFFAWACQTARYKAMEYRRRHQTEMPILDADVAELLAKDVVTRSDALDARIEALRSCLAKLRLGDRYYLLFRGMKKLYREEGLGAAVSADLVHWSRVKQSQTEPLTRTEEEIASFAVARAGGTLRGHFTDAQSPRTSAVLV